MVSIILPTYNRASLLTESIRSVLDQDFTDFELLVMDDGSEDDTEKIVRAFDDPRIRYFPLPHSGYTSRLKNEAIRHSRGDLLAFIDSDDCWRAGKLTKQVNLLAEQSAIGFSITDVTTFQGDQILIDHSYHLQRTVECRNIFQWLKQSRFIIYNPTLVIRKRCLERVGGFDETMRSGDYHFNMRLAFHYDAGILYESLLWRRVHDSNMSNEMPLENYEEYLATFAHLREQKMIERKYLWRARANAFYKTGVIYQSQGNPLLARKYFGRALRYNPFRARTYLAWLRSVNVPEPTKPTE